MGVFDGNSSGDGAGKASELDNDSNVAGATAKDALNVLNANKADRGDVITNGERTKLAGVEDGAQRQRTPTEVRAAYESNPDTNRFGDAARAKLDRVEDGATANAPDGQLRNRATHTGTQPLETVDGLPVALDVRPPAVNGRYPLSALPEDIGGVLVVESTPTRLVLRTGDAGPGTDVDGGGPSDYTGALSGGVDGGGPADY